jgi:hypothetical protein
LFFTFRHPGASHTSANSPFTLKQRESAFSVDGKRNSRYSVDFKEVYHLGVIDFLQEWDLNKKTEAKLKQVFLGYNSELISAVPPAPYQRRFYNFVTSILLPNEDDSLSVADFGGTGSFLSPKKFKSKRVKLEKLKKEILKDID